MKNALVMAGYVERVAKTKFNLTDVDKESKRRIKIK